MPGPLLLSRVVYKSHIQGGPIKTAPCISLVIHAITWLWCSFYSSNWSEQSTRISFSRFKQNSPSDLLHYWDQNDLGQAYRLRTYMFAPILYFCICTIRPEQDIEHTFKNAVHPIHARSYCLRTIQYCLVCAVILG